MAASLGLPLEALRKLATRLEGCGYGVIVYDGEAPDGGRVSERAWALGMLARDASLRSCVRIVALRCGGWGDANLANRERADLAHRLSRRREHRARHGAVRPA